MEKTPKLGKNERKALDFIRRVNGWHTFDSSTKPAIMSLQRKGLVYVVGSQFIAVR